MSVLAWIVAVAVVLWLAFVVLVYALCAVAHAAERGMARRRPRR
jgi:type IV secretory pathway TrbD component